MVSVDRLALYNSLKILARLTPTKSPTPILANALLVVSDGKFTVTTTDVTSRLSHELPANGENFTTCVTAKALVSMLKPETKRDAEQVSLGLEGNRLLVEVDGVTSRLPTANPTQFPSGVGASLEWSLIGMCNAQPLRDAIAWVLPAASTDATRRHLCAMLVDPDGVAVTTDGHRMHVAPSPISPETPLLIASSAADILHRVLTDGSLVILARAKSGGCEVLRVRCGAWQLETTLVDATFPPYKHVLPNRGDQPTRLTIEKALFIKALRRVTAAAKSNVRLCINGAITVSAEDNDGGEASVVVPVSANTHTGEDLIIGFDPHYLIDAVQGGDDAVELGLTKPLDPLRVDQSNGRIAVIMPCRL